MKSGDGHLLSYGSGISSGYAGSSGAGSSAESGLVESSTGSSFAWHAFQEFPQGELLSNKHILSLSPSAKKSSPSHHRVGCFQKPSSRWLNPR